MKKRTVSWEGQILKQLNPPPLICLPIRDLCQHPQGKTILFPQQNQLCTSGLGINYQAQGREPIKPGGMGGQEQEWGRARREAGGRLASGVAASRSLFHLPSLRPEPLSLSVLPFFPLAVSWGSGPGQPTAPCRAIAGSGDESKCPWGPTSVFPLNFPPEQNLSITYGSRVVTCHSSLLDSGPSNSFPETAASSQ